MTDSELVAAVVELLRHIKYSLRESAYVECPGYDDLVARGVLKG